MTTKAEVLNGALFHLGQPPVSGPTDTSTWVKRLTERYNSVVKSLLEQHPWNFASAWEELAVLAETPVSNRTYAHNKPAKCLRLNLVNTSGDPDDTDFFQYEDEGGKILSDSESIFVSFVSKDWLTQEGSWPQMFADAVSAKLAAACSATETKNLNKRNNVHMLAREALKAAKSFDASQKPFRPLPAGTWSRARRTGTRYNTEGR